MIFVFLLIIAYFGYYVYSFFSNNTNNLYDVSEGSASAGGNTIFNALILREETVVKSSKSGYINFFAGDGVPVSVGHETYVIDPTGELSDRLKEASQNQAVLNENDLNRIKSTIYDFDTAYDPGNYFETYSFKYRVQSQILDLINSNVFQDMSGSVSNEYTIVKSDIAGIIQHSVDGFEGIGLDDVESALFRKANYNKKIIRSNDYVESEDDIYKIVTSEKWKLVIQLEEPEIFADKKWVEFKFLSDDVNADADFETFTRSGVTYGVLSLNKYMIRYISDRYTQIEIFTDTNKGLKVPKSSVTEKQFYQIPVNFISTGGNTTSKGFLKQTAAGVQFITPDIYYEDDNYYYISVDDVDPGDVLVRVETGDTFKVNPKVKFNGVYVSNGAMSVYKVINIIGESGNYYIIEDGAPYGVKIYDKVYYNPEDAYDK